MNGLSPIVSYISFDVTCRSHWKRTVNTQNQRTDCCFLISIYRRNRRGLILGPLPFLLFLYRQHLQYSVISRLSTLSVCRRHSSSPNYLWSWQWNYSTWSQPLGFNFLFSQSILQNLKFFLSSCSVSIWLFSFFPNEPSVSSTDLCLHIFRCLPCNTSWSHHINTICRKAKRIIGSILGIFNLLVHFWTYILQWLGQSLSTARVSGIHHPLILWSLSPHNYHHRNIIPIFCRTETFALSFND